MELSLMPQCASQGFRVSVLSAVSQFCVAATLNDPWAPRRVGVVSLDRGARSGGRPFLLARCLRRESDRLRTRYETTRSLSGSRRESGA